MRRSEFDDEPSEVEMDSSRATDVLDGIPGAYEQAQLGLEQARAGEAVDLDEL